MFLGVGVLMPVLATLATFLTSDKGLVASAVLPQYLLLLFVQVAQENDYIKEGTPQHEECYLLDVSVSSCTLMSSVGP